ncbi:MAG: nucleotidyltransferase domain-containing protein [Antarcticimicrobium sp.]|uniref:nucleotidyltransferase domain-containing protein n=1 Tax=Antarcticimicrobium sp. TaxID=2824147 RepID=UPI002602813E|nr:nucleotidyltransferase domain-containing protein [Antarcticimicrobium sp.]MDF1719033.1 nucleotidyltransferase domain-containing protein [Antarcticimicrobium sp.]
MWTVRDIDADAAREAINASDRYDALRDAQRDLDRRFDGSMAYEAIKGAEYLIRRSSRRAGARSRRSLGSKSPENDARLDEFNRGKAALKERIAGLKDELNRRRRIIAARGLGRMPFETAGVLRRLDRQGWLGGRLHVVGTNALYAYEAAAGIQIDAGELATDDIDILNDARRHVALSGDLPPEGLVGVLRQVDKSFAPMSPGSFRAVNKTGFLVDLIGPHGYDPTRIAEPAASEARRRARLSDHPDDLQPVGIDGMEWLLNAPRFEAVTFDTRGNPVWIPTVDPRVFAAHKLWLSQRPDRERTKQRRDHVQAVIAAVLAEAYLGLSFGDSGLSAVPRGLITGIEGIRPEIDTAIARLPHGGL